MNRFGLAALAAAVLGLAACERSPLGGEEPELVGTYALTSVGFACDVAVGRGLVEGGRFDPEWVDGTMTFREDGTVTHDFEIAGTCTLPDGREVEIDAEWADTGSYTATGGGRVRMTHQGISCTGALGDDGVLSVRTGSLFPDVRFTYRLEREA